MLVPVCVKNVVNTLTCESKVRAVMSNTNRESMALSVTTVPKALGKDTLSYLWRIPQRANSPMRGMRRLTAYDMKTAWQQVVTRDFSPIGSSVCRHLKPRNICANMPNGKESNIHVQFISWSMTCSTCLKSKSRYIQ